MKSPNEIGPCNLDDYQKLAKKRIPKALYEYLSSGTEDEQTLAENKAAFKLWYLRPRMMVPVENLSSRTNTWPGTPQSIAMPVFVTPAGVHGLCHPDGELASARACARVGIPFALSQHSTRSIEEVAAAVRSIETAQAPILWYQAYLLKDRSRTLALIKRAVNAGYQGIFLTVDSVRFGYREADVRNGFNALPPPHRLVNYDDVSPLGSKAPQKLEKVYNAKKAKAWDQNIEKLFETNVSWEAVRWLKENGCPDVPLFVKGILTREDACLAIEIGKVDGIMVSNHGGRQLDCALASLDALPEVAEAVNGRVPVFLDSGVRRGTDALKALALGATAVGLGRPIFYALAVGGESAVVELLRILKNEIESSMALCGLDSVDKITRNLVTRHPSGGPLVPFIRSSL